MKWQLDTYVFRFREAFELATLAATDDTQKPLFKIRIKYINQYYEENIRKEMDNVFIGLQLSYKHLFPAAEPPVPRSDLANNSSNVKPTKIKITVFDGTLKRWSTFRDTYNNLVHNNGDYSKIEKFHYLVASLEKTSLSIVAYVPMIIMI